MKLLLRLAGILAMLGFLALVVYVGASILEKEREVTTTIGYQGE